MWVNNWFYPKKEKRKKWVFPNTNNVPKSVYQLKPFTFFSSNFFVAVNVSNHLWILISPKGLSLYFCKPCFHIADINGTRCTHWFCFIRHGPLSWSHKWFMGYKCVLQAKLGGVCHVCHVSQHNKTRSYIISFHILSKVKSRIWCKKKKITYMVSHKTLVNAYLVV